MARDEKLIRYIGVDFGTSTSAVFHKDYHEDGRPLRKDDASPVKFDINKTTVPTLVLEDPEGRTYFGWEAERRARSKPKLQEYLRSEFKMVLVAEDPGEVERAKELAGKFFEHLYKTYREQATAGHGVEVEERTFVSYPAKWPAAAREATIEAAKEAGFMNVEGVEEPSAAMSYFLNVRTSAVEDAMEELRLREVLVEGEPVTTLLIDMGAGTTDFVLYRYTPGKGDYEFLPPVWPPVGREGFGGREVDELLWTRILDPVVRAGTESLGLPYEAFAGRFERTARPWKEEEVSPVLRDGGRVEALPADFSLMVGTGPELRLDRERFEEEIADYLEHFPRLLRELVEHAVEEGSIESGEDVDLVVLTGGHSQWYFVKEMLAAAESPLGKVRSEPYRGVRGPHPQETVARGLAMGGMFGRAPQVETVSVKETNKAGANLEPGRESQSSEITQKWITETGDDITALDFTPDSSTLVLGTHEGIELRDSYTGVLQGKLLEPMGRMEKFFGGGKVWDVSVDPDGSTLASAEMNTTSLWDLQTGKIIKKYEGSSNEPFCSVDFSSDGRSLANVGKNFFLFDPPSVRVTIWDTHTDQALANLEHGQAYRDPGIENGPGRVSRVIFSPDGQLLVCLTDPPWKLAMWNPHKSEMLWDLGRRKTFVWCASFSPDGSLLAIGGSGGHYVDVLDSYTGKRVRTLGKGQPGGANHNGEVSSVAFHPDGNLLASYGDNYSVIKIWNPHTGDLLQSLTVEVDAYISWDFNQTTLITEPPRGVSFSPNGQLLVLCYRQNIWAWEIGKG